MPSIDLNADLGENTPERPVSDDESMLRLVTSANVSCGFHAGSREGIAATVSMATAGNVTIGGHPSYRDFANFGRSPLEIDAAALQAEVEEQIRFLKQLADEVGGAVRYVKPHGALYNRIAHDPAQATAVVSAVSAVDPSLVVLGLAGGVLLDIAEQAGLATASEAFPDRAYAADGSLVPRTEPGAVLHDPAVVAERAVQMALRGTVDSICLHGDTPGSVAIAAACRAALDAAGVTVRAFA